MIAASRRLKRVTRIFDPYQDRSDFIRLDRNEDPIGWDSERFSAWLATLTPYDVAAYADATTLVDKLAAWLDVEPRNLYVTAGSDAAIKNVFETYVDPGDRVLLQDPGWRMYEVYANAYGAEMVPIPYSRDLKLDIERIIAELCRAPVRMLVLANPNQPTGTLIDENALLNLIVEAKQRDVLVVMDEAYHLFTQQTTVALAREYDNLIVVRTFSKAFGLAGLRIGYCVSAVERIKELMLLRPVTDANSLALKCADYVLDHMDWMNERIADFVAGREFLFREMQATGVATHASHTNFLLIRCASMDCAREAIAKIRNRGYLLKGPFGFAPLENCIRVSIGPLHLMQRFWIDCADVLRTHSAPTFISSNVSV